MAIFIDGVDVETFTEMIYGQIGMVLQDTFLFNGTVMEENIAYAKPDATPEERLLWHVKSQTLRFYY